jgi:hypothetical protein
LTHAHNQTIKERKEGKAKVAPDWLATFSRTYLGMLANAMHAQNLACL